MVFIENLYERFAEELTMMNIGSMTGDMFFEIVERMPITPTDFCGVLLAGGIRARAINEVKDLVGYLRDCKKHGAIPFEELNFMYDSRIDRYACQIKNTADEDLLDSHVGDRIMESRLMGGRAQIIRVGWQDGRRLSETQIKSAFGEFQRLLRAIKNSDYEVSDGYMGISREDPLMGLSYVASTQALYFKPSKDENKDTPVRAMLEGIVAN